MGTQILEHSDIPEWFIKLGTTVFFAGDIMSMYQTFGEITRAADDTLMVPVRTRTRTGWEYKDARVEDLRIWNGKPLVNALEKTIYLYTCATCPADHNEWEAAQLHDANNGHMHYCGESGAAHEPQWQPQRTRIQDRLVMPIDEIPAGECDGVC